MSMSVEDMVKHRETSLQQSMLDSLRMFDLQQKAHKDAERITTLANIEKAKHDAIMNMANNIK